MRTFATGVVCLSCVLVACGSSGGGSPDGGLNGLLTGGSGSSATSGSSGSGTGSGTGTSGSGTGSSGNAATGSASGSISGIAGASGALSGATSGASGVTSGASGTMSGTVTGTTSGASGVTTGASGVTSGASGTASGSTSGTTTTACTTISQVGAAVTPMVSTGAAPSPGGGTLVDGTYALTAFTLYGADTSCQTELQDVQTLGIGTVSETYVLSGSTVDVVSVEFGTANSTTSTFAVDGTELAVDTTCSAAGSTGTSVVGFTAAGTTVLLFGTDPDCGLEVQTLVKQ
jgi:hypothetical protein